MRAVLVAVGDELVNGDVVDTNSAWLARRLVALGVDVSRHVSVDDDLDELTAVLRAAVADAGVVVVTGGLGPTPDDLTRYAVARVAGVPLERRPELVSNIRGHFTRRGRDMPGPNLVQADLPRGANAIAPVGTAPGFTVEVDGALIACLPGVPVELERMVDDSLLPLLRDRGGLVATVVRTIHTAGIAESEVAERVGALVGRLASGGGSRLRFLSSQGQTRVQVVGRGADVAAARAQVDPVVDELVDLLGGAVTGLDDERVEHAVGRLLSRRGWTLAVGESITGGGVGARLVTVPGASAWFTGGVIAYATAAKPVLADVAQAVLDEHGPVSEVIAATLADGVRRRLGTDVGLGVVGVAGPTAQGGRPVGTVCLGVALPHAATWTRTVELPPRSRTDLQQSAAGVALESLRRRLVAAVT
jgi:nicotinamide-nucleotide amidase